MAGVCLTLPYLCRDSPVKPQLVMLFRFEPAECRVKDMAQYYPSGLDKLKAINHAFFFVWSCDLDRV